MYLRRPERESESERKYIYTKKANALIIFVRH